MDARISLKCSLSAVAIALLVSTATALLPATAQEAAHAPPQQLVDALHAAFGDHHTRAVHAKASACELCHDFIFRCERIQIYRCEGNATFVRYRFVPKEGEQFVPAAELQAKGPNYLLRKSRHASPKPRLSLNGSRKSPVLATRSTTLL